LPELSVELEHVTRVAPNNLTEWIATSELLLPPDDEWLLAPYVEDRDHGAAA
jgi:hypothetical protein